MSSYINNLETGHIELHFSKPEYMAMTDAQKASLKSNFLFSSSISAWISRSTQNHFSAIRCANSLGFTEEKKTGERLSFAEQIERKAEKAEARADRMESHSDNAQRRAETLQAPINRMHGDIAFFTQPNINSSSGRAFTNRRNQMFAQYERGFDEYRKSAYFAGRADIARKTASMAQLKDAIYLNNRIKEGRAEIKKLQARIVEAEEANNDTWLARLLDLMEAEMDKLGFFENCMEEIGGVQFSPENIKVGYVVEIKRGSRQCEIVSVGPVNVKYKILTGGAAGMVLTAAYAEIEKIVAVKQAAPVVNPYKESDILCLHRPADDSVYRAFQVLKATDKSVQIQEIAVVAGVPQAGQFKANSKPERKGITKSKYSDFVGAYYGDWQMHKYAN
jgi:hypothetical protein